MLALLGVLAAGSTCAIAQEPAESSPLRALELRDEAVLAATTLDEVLHLFSPEERAYVADLSAEQKAQGLAQWQASLSEGGQRPVYERVDGDRAAVLLEDDPRPLTGIAVVVMELVDGHWVAVGDVWLNDGVPGSTAGYSVSGSVTADLAAGLVTSSAVNGVPIVVVGDPVTDLAKGVDGDRVQIPFAAQYTERCFEVGVMELETIVTEGDYGVTVHGGFFPASAAAAQFKLDMSGSLEVAEIDGDHFTGTYAMTAVAENGESVNISGTIDHGLMPCAYF